MKSTFFHRAVVVAVLLVSSVTLRAQWKEVALPAPFNNGYYLDVFFLPSNPNYGWSCSMEGFIVRTTDGGRTWRGTSLPGAFLEYIQFLSPTVGYTSGEDGVFRSTDGGQTWLPITPINPNFEKGWGSYWLDEYEGLYFVGGCATGIQAFYRTTDGGQSWTVFNTTEPLSGLSDGIIYPNGVGYAVSSGVIWQTLDRGQTWRRFSYTGTKVWSEELAIFGTSMLVPTSGTDCDGLTRGVGSMRFSRDGGRTWREYSTRANMFGSFLLDERRGWGVGDNRAVLYTEDYGATWDRKNCGIRGNIDDIWFVNDTLGWAVGQGIYRSNFNAPAAFVRIAPDEDLTICPDDSVYLQAASNTAEIRWSDGIVAPGRYVSTPGVYVATVFDSTICSTVSDTIRVRLRSTVVPRITASAAAVCEGDSIELRVDGPIVSRTWSTGETTDRIVVRTGGVYTCRTRDTAGCEKTLSFTATVRPLPTPEITANRSLTICLDDVITLAATPGYRSYQWNTGDVGPTLTTSEGGRYVVSVVDAFGCVGTSDTITVVKLETRNKAEILSASSAGAIVLDDHDVGSMTCRDVQIRNRSLDESLLITRPYLIGNVFFSIPLSQLPIVIPPGSTASLRLCASAIDTGEVQDTLALPDTCSTEFVPVVTRGRAITFAGASRCDVGVTSLVIRAGSTWQMSAPFPVPASGTVSVAVRAVTGSGGYGQVTLRSVTGQIVRARDLVITSVLSDATIGVDDLPSGPYMLCIEADGEVLGTSVVRVVH